MRVLERKSEKEHHKKKLIVFIIYDHRHNQLIKLTILKLFFSKNKN